NKAIKNNVIKNKAMNNKEIEWSHTC
ncbi:MAG: hypothetical protein PWP51_3017, partial [Clostridiales bacterium]|nr:hypothetical protein [Clostridiales bacterium]